MTRLLLRIVECELMPRQVREDALLIVAVIVWWL